MNRRQFLTGSAALALIVPDLQARIGGVEIGVCRGADELQAAADAGFDYLEPPAGVIAEMDENAFQRLKNAVEKSSIRCEAFNNFIRRRELKVVGEDVSRASLIAYLEPALARCKDLGGTVVVWGSAGSRNVPPGFSRQRAWEQIREFLGYTGDIAAAHSITIGIEPLRRQESNIINRGSEALQLVKEVHHPNIKMIIDYYHLSEEKENPEIIWQARKEIVHFHFANPMGRVWPKDPTEDPGYAAFFRQVKRIKFRGGLSIEGNGSIANDARASLDFFRRELA